MEIKPVTGITPKSPIRAIPFITLITTTPIMAITQITPINTNR